MLRIAVLITALLLSIFTFWIVFTEPGNAPLPLEGTVVLDGKTYTKQQVLDDFLKVAFVDQPWSDAPYMEVMIAGKRVDKPEALVARRRQRIRPAKYISKEAWWSRFYYTDDFLPHLNALHRWADVKQLGVTFIYPSPYPQDRSQALRQVVVASGSFVQQLSHLTGVAMFVEAIGERKDLWSAEVLSNKKDQAKQIRISFVSASPVGAHSFTTPSTFNLFKKKGFGAIAIDAEFSFDYYIDPLLARKIAYTVGVNAQVDGYFLHEANNEIGAAICPIPYILPENLMLSLVRECLVRSLGLPGLSANSSALLGNYNAAYNHMTDPTATQAFEAASPQPMTEYDEAMLRLLYCADMKVGDTKEQIHRRLQRSSCL